MAKTSFVSQNSIKLKGRQIPGAEDRQGKIPGFDQQALSGASIVCIGAGGLMSFIAPTLARKGVGAITVLDHDIVETSNLNRQRFYQKDVGKNKALCFARNLRGECTADTEIRAYALRFEEAVEAGVELTCSVAICGVDNNPARVAASRYFRRLAIPIIFTAVSNDGDHGYVFVQSADGPCIGCLFPDMANDDRYPCPGTPAVADVLQAVGALVVFAVDSLVMPRLRKWSYRRLSLSDGEVDGASIVPARHGCTMFAQDLDEGGTAH
jgi:molybdopterin/thiamine biosynthesis adenylyltransferase